MSDATTVSIDTAKHIAGADEDDHLFSVLRDRCAALNLEVRLRDAALEEANECVTALTKRVAELEDQLAAHRPDQGDADKTAEPAT